MTCNREQCQATDITTSPRKRSMRSERPHSPSSTATTVSSSSASSTSTDGSSVSSPARGKTIHFNAQQRDVANAGRGGYDNGRRLSPTRNYYSSPPRQQHMRNGKNQRYNKSRSPPRAASAGQSLIHDSHPNAVLRNKYTGSIHDAPMSKRDIYFALDCEMVGVGPEGLDSAVARVTVVNWDEEIVLDTFVKVPVPVTDYRTFVSGIKAEDIDENSSAVSLRECRQAVMTLLRGKILIGHALQNDLQALGITHPWTDTRDTAMYPPYMREMVDAKTKERVWVPRKLRDLTWETLGKQIQCGGKSHSPVEDALAALGLYKAARSEWEIDMVQRAKIAREEEESRKMMRDQTAAMGSMAAVSNPRAVEMSQRERAGNVAKARAQAEAAARAQLVQQQQAPIAPPLGCYHPSKQHPQQQQRHRTKQFTHSPPSSPNHPSMGQQQQPPQHSKPSSNVNKYYQRIPPQMTPVPPSSARRHYDAYNYGYPPMMQQQQHVPKPNYSRPRYHSHGASPYNPTAAPPALQV